MAYESLDYLTRFAKVPDNLELKTGLSIDGFYQYMRTTVMRENSVHPNAYKIQQGSFILTQVGLQRTRSASRLPR